MLIGIAALNVPIPAIGDTAIPASVGSVSQANFQSWVKTWSIDQDAWITDWWSADLDEDGKPDFVARVCRNSSDHALGAFLVQNASGKRFIDRFEFGWSPAGCNLWTQDRPQPFRRTRDRFIHYVMPIKRAGTDEVWLALRDGQLVVMREKGDASYAAFPGSVQGGGKQKDGRWQLESSVMDLHPWSGNWQER